MTVFLFAPPRQGTDWRPAVDIYRATAGWVLKFEMAGVRLDDVQAHVCANTVTVSGLRRDWLLEDAGCHHYSMEIAYSRFERVVELPEDLSDALFRLEYRDGILLVRITRREDDNND